MRISIAGLFLFMALFVAGCGGGGGGSGGSDQGGTEPTSIRLLGTVVETSTEPVTVSVMEYETEHVFGTTTTDASLEWAVYLPAGSLPAGELLVIEASAPSYRLPLRSVISTDAVRASGLVYQSDLTTISRFSEAALLVSEIAVDLAPQDFLASVLRTDEQRRHIATRHHAVNELAGVIRDQGLWGDRSSFAQHRAEVLSAALQILWPVTLEAAKQHAIQLPTVGAYSDFYLAPPVSVSGVDLLGASGAEIVIAGQSATEGALELELRGAGIQPVRIALPAIVVEKIDLAAGSVGAGQRPDITAGPLTVAPSPGSFPEGASYSIRQLGSLPGAADFNLLTAFEIQWDRVPAESVTLRYPLGNGVSEDNLILVHVDSASKQERVIYPHQISMDGTHAEFLVDRFSFFGLGTKNDAPAYALGQEITSDQFLNDTQKMLDFVREDIISFLDDEDRIKDLNGNCSSTTINEIKNCISYFERLSSKALASFMRAVEDDGTLSGLNSRTVNSGFWQKLAFWSTSNALDEYVALRARVERVAAMLGNTLPLASLNQSDAWGGDTRADSDNIELELLYTQTATRYYFPMIAHRLVRLGRPDLGFRLGRLRDDLWNDGGLTHQQKCDASVGLANYLDTTYRAEILARGPRLPGATSGIDYLLGEYEAFGEVIGNAISRTWSSYQVGATSTEAVIETLKPFVNKFLLGAGAGVETAYTLYKGFGEYEDIFGMVVTNNGVAAQIDRARERDIWNLNSAGYWSEVVYHNQNWLIPKEVNDELLALDGRISSFRSCPPISPDPSEPPPSDPGPGLPAYSVTASAGTGGSISPSSVSVNHGATASFTVTPSNGYEVASVTGCGGTLSGNTYTTGPLNGACAVSASFTPRIYTVTITSGSGGSVSPSTAMQVPYSERAVVDVTPSMGNLVLVSVGGSCERGSWGSDAAGFYESGPVTDHCTLEFSFTPTPPLGERYVKLDESGKALSSGAVHWSCIRDEQTGLVWEVKTDDGGLRDRNHKYSWYNPDDDEYSGVPGVGACAGGISCDTFHYQDAVNATALCGITSWRMPRLEELVSLLYCSNLPPDPPAGPYSCWSLGGNYGIPTINTRAFPNTNITGYWSGDRLYSGSGSELASTLAFYDGKRWHVQADYPYMTVRLVAEDHNEQVAGFALNDTGIVFCGEESHGNNNPCTSNEPWGQDAHHGRDALAAAGTLAKVGGGNAGFDYTKIANNGSELPATAALGTDPNDWACTRDNVTGLMWEVKVDNPSHLRHQNNTYTWYDPNSPDGNPGVQNGGICVGVSCDTRGFVEAVNDQRLCGAGDWRMPTRRELQGIVDFGRYSPSIDTAFFPNTPSHVFWSGSPLADNSKNWAWALEFDSGMAQVGWAMRSDRWRVRLVRGAH